MKSIKKTCLFLLLLAGLYACKPDQDPLPPNIIFIMSDDVPFKPKHYPASYAKKYPKGKIHVTDYRVVVEEDDLLEMFEGEPYLVKSSGNFSNGIKDGKWTFWYNNGTREQGEFIDGKREGVWIEKYYHGQLRSRIRYTNNVAFGKITYYYMNGQKEEETTYANRDESTITQWYLNGQKEYEFHFKNDIPHGTYLCWHSNGLKFIEGRTKYGKEEGISSRWNEKGEKIKEIEYKNGEIIRVLIGNKENITNQFRMSETSENKIE